MLYGLLVPSLQFDSSVQLRWARGAGIWNWEDKFLRCGRSENGGALVMICGNECWKREWWIQEKLGGEEAGPDGFNLCSRTRPSALNVKD
jgi:hypothetical protein